MPAVNTTIYMRGINETKVPKHGTINGLLEPVVAQGGHADVVCQLCGYMTEQRLCRLREMGRRGEMVCEAAE